MAERRRKRYITSNVPVAPIVENKTQDFIHVVRSTAPHCGSLFVSTIDSLVDISTTWRNLSITYGQSVRDSRDSQSSPSGLSRDIPRSRSATNNNLPQRRPLSIQRGHHSRQFALVYSYIQFYKLCGSGRRALRSIK